MARRPGGAEKRRELAGRVVIGRAASADLALEGGRVSRRHAAVELRDGRVRVEDLGSANGTRVGGRRTAGPVELPSGATVRIGEWELAVETGSGEAVAPVERTPALPAAAAGTGSPTPGAADAEASAPRRTTGSTGHRSTGRGPRPPAGRSRGRRRIAIAGVALSVLAALAWASGSAYAERPRSPEAGAAAEAGAGRERGGPIRGAAARLARWRVEVAGARLVLAERRAAGDFGGARAAVERLAGLDPLEPDLAAARAALAIEEAAAEREAAARERAALGRDEEALALYTSIPAGSWYHGRARDAALRLLRERLAPALRATCVDRLRAGRRAEALPACRRYLDATCHERIDEAVAGAVNRAARGRREAAWACPPELGAWLAAGEPVAGEGVVARAIRSRFPDSAVADALLLHFRDGRPREARAALERRAAGARPEGDPGLATALEELDGRLVEARARLLAGDLEAAEAALSRAASVEAALLPNAPPSPALAAARGSVAAALRERGDEHLALGRDGLAHAAFARVLALAPADAAARRGLERLEARASERLDRDPSCDAARAALSFTSPDGAAHGRARARLGTPACRGVGAF